jgi:ubiquinone/menaquinone biosynthesis C-methylase UbiE
MFKAGQNYIEDVQTIYSGAVGQLWELLMGEQIHIGGFASSTDLAAFGGVKPGMTGIDFCCCSGAGMRFLLKMCGVARMEGIDFTKGQITLGKKRMKEIGLKPSQFRFHLGDVALPHVKAGAFDFAWGEDAWCYVADKPGLVSQAYRALKPSGRIIFSDWVATDKMTAADARRFMAFMKFPTFMTVADYKDLLAKTGFKKVKAKVSPYFVPSMDLYAAMFIRQHAFDALKLLGFNKEVYSAVLGEFNFIVCLAKSKKLVQGYFTAER